MKNRSGQALYVQRKHSTNQTTVLPMPGRLSVWNDDQPFATLDEFVPGDTVYTVGTITHIRYLDTARVRRAVRTGDRAGLGRAMAVIRDSSGNTAHIYLHADVTAQALPALAAGTKVSVAGVVFHTVPSQPAGINARSVRAVNV